jgi:hypothetical protein
MQIIKWMTNGDVRIWNYGDDDKWRRENMEMDAISNRDGQLSINALWYIFIKEII